MPDAPKPPTEAEVTAHIAACEDQGELRDLWNQWPDLRAEIKERVDALKAKVTDAP